MARGRQSLKATLRKYYLFFYNVGLFLIHLLVFSAILDEIQHRNYVYLHHFPWLLVATALQLLDLLHGYLGWTKTSIGTGAVQVFGRLFILWVAYYVELDRPQWSTPFLCLAYMTIELFRYPYYAARVLNKDFEGITWLRYNAWIVCYPVGLFLEFLTLNQAFKGRHVADLYAQYADVPVLKEPTFKWGIQIAFLYVLFPYVAYTLLGHMWKQRERKQREMTKKKH